STSQCPADTASVHSACALAVRMPLILVDAWVQASVSSTSRALPSVGFLAVHVSATPRSVSMAMHAFRTPVSISPATLTRFADAAELVASLRGASDGRRGAAAAARGRDDSHGHEQQGAGHVSHSTIVHESSPSTCAYSPRGVPI